MLTAAVLSLVLLAADDGGAPPVNPLASADRLLLDEDNTAGNLEAALRAYDAALASSLPPPVAARAYARKAMALLRLGDLTADVEQKRALYKRGQAEAEKGITADKRCADAHFYRSANLGRWGESRGVMQSLFLVKDVVGGMKTTVELDPNHLDAALALGLVDQRVPGFAGGSKVKAEKAFRGVLQRSPHFTRAMLDLAELLEDTGRKEEALRWAAQARDEPQPLSPGDWRKFDKPRAERLLAEWKR